MIFAANKAMKKIYIIIITLVLISVTVFFHHRKENRENLEMENFASLIADETDHEFETATTDILEKIKNNELFNSWVKNDNLPSDDSLLSYFEKQYFSNIDLFNIYNIALTVCDSNTYIALDNKPDIEYPCIEYFKDIFKFDSVAYINNGLYHIDDPMSNFYYIAKIDINGTQNLYFEFYKEKNVIPNLKNYSYGIYKNNILNYKLGNYYYPNNINNFISQTNGIHKGKKFKHFIFNDSSLNKTVVVSIESERWMRYVAPFSFIFLALLLAYFLFTYFEHDRKGTFKNSFHSKMQLTIVLTLTISFVAIGITSFLFLENNITKKTQIEQYKQANIIRNRLESNMLSENSLTNADYLYYLEETFFCDLNIYNLAGVLINSTLKNSKVLNDSIESHAYQAIFKEDAGYLVQNEMYDNEKCTSYYFPILDENNHLAAVLNVIYFDSKSEYDDQLSDFALNYINIIIVLLGISSIIVLLITRKTLKPLKIIEDQMGKVRLDGHNEPINFKGRDEIGALVEQYNNMCRQLEIAANKIARNERENAWREMARQVAHEIKNPLTPMQLNIEYLQMLWDRKDPKFEENFKETLKSLLEQIETLSKIATAFSDYAKLPENVSTTFDLSELLKNTIKLYDVEENISISLIYNENEDWSMFADKNNLGRVFGNIIKNGIQAIGSEVGHIEVILNRLGEKYRIQITDNGCGIKEEDKKKVFFPNFTTKSSGMGVGLSVSQNIIQGMGGNISFASKEGIGTVFTIDIPILKEK